MTWQQAIIRRLGCLGRIVPRRVEQRIFLVRNEWGKILSINNLINLLGRSNVVDTRMPEKININAVH